MGQKSAGDCNPRTRPRLPQCVPGRGGGRVCVVSFLTQFCLFFACFFLPLTGAALEKSRPVKKTKIIQVLSPQGRERVLFVKFALFCFSLTLSLLSRVGRRGKERKRERERDKRNDRNGGKKWK